MRPRRLIVRWRLARQKVQPIAKVCPRCGSDDIAPIVYGYQTPELEKKVRHGEVVYGGRVPFEGMPTLACRRCLTKFATGQRKRTFSSSATLASSLILFLFVGFFVGNATIVPDPVLSSALNQLFMGSVSASTPMTDVIFWLLGLLSAIALFIIGILTRRKAFVWGGGGYTCGFLFSSLLLGSWLTIVVEVIGLTLFLVGYAIFSE